MASHTHGPASTSSPAPAGPPADAVRVEGLIRSFDGRAVINGLDLTLRAGEFTAVLGRGGSGKSTLLRVLAGLDREIRGTVLVPKRRALVFRAPRPTWWSQVRRRVLPGLPGRPERAAAERDLATAGTTERSRVRPRRYSGDEAPRASLAQVLAGELDLLLLDEPSGAPDAPAGTAAQRLVTELRRHRGCAVLLVTRDVDEALLLADRALVLRDGVIAYGTPVASDRPRRPGTPEFAALRTRLLDELGTEAGPPALPGADPSNDLRTRSPRSYGKASS
ncbi:ATP-binding cassette domain-containing protein [Streptomyces sp. NPDC048428]|uniref:ATP-binding cassette domain-containing protein n=1 Tax=Streptomyces sp. NPDC048428 TaxID=3154503 RepID=UPI0034342770